MEKLGSHRTEGAAGHDDRAFSAKRSAGSDRDCGRDRLQNRKFRFNAAAIKQNRLDGFWDSVTSNAFGSISSHEADDHAADNRNQNDESSEMMSNRLRRPNADSLIKDDISE